MAVLPLEVAVDVIKFVKKTGYVLFFLSLTLQNAFSEIMAKGRTKFKLLMNLYHQNGDEARQVYDDSEREEANVAEPMIFIDHQITEDTVLNGHFVFDFWTAASDTKLDANTGASNEEAIKGQTRVSGTVGATKETGDWTLSANGGFSTEYDYRSFNGSVAVQRSFAQDNFTLGLDVQYYDDGIKLFDDLTPPGSAEISEFKTRNILATSLTASQILTPKDIVQFGTTFARATGHLESTASSTVVNGTRELESLPDSRSRYAFSTKWVHGMGENWALNSSYRYYTDQWDLTAHTIRFALLRELDQQDDLLELSLRYHNQSEVEYWGDSFNSLNTHRTSDSDLEDFSAYEGGVYYSSLLGNKELFGYKLENMRWNNGVVYYTRTNGLRYGYYQSAISFEF